MKIFYKIAKNAIEGRLLQVVFKSIINSIKKIFSVIRSAIDWGFAYITRILLSRTNKVNPQKIMFITYNNEYICNPKYIMEEINRQQLPLDVVWGVSKKQLKESDFPENVRLVVRGTYDFFKEVATSKVWIDNALCFTWNPLPKKKEQFYLQTWHGSLGLKRIGKENVKNRRWSFAASLATKWTDLCISNSTFETDVFRQTHWPKTPILELGHARNDIFFLDYDAKKEIRRKVCAYYGFSEDKKIVLYAPTFRNTDDISAYDLDHSRFLNALEERFGGEWVILNRYHFKTKKARGFFNQAVEQDERLFSATSYPDIQELMIASDAGITDYSSWICDFIFTNRPGFLYTPDLQSYDQERGFYYPLSDTPFPVAETNDALEKAILAFDMELFTAKREAFLKARGCKEEGTASKKIVEIIKEKCGLK